MSISPCTTDQQTETGPPVAHSWCTCWERDGIGPIPSLCGGAHKDNTPSALDWPADRMACVICAAIISSGGKCPRCGGPE